MHAYSLDHDCKYYFMSISFALIRFLNYQKEYYFFCNTFLTKLSNKHLLCGCLRKFQPFYLPSF